MSPRILPIALCSVLALAITACKPAAPPDASSSPAAGAPVTYQCDGLTLTAQFQGDHMTLRAPGVEYVLPSTVAASGAKFESDHAMVWSKGNEALVKIDGQDYANCREVSAAEAPPGP